MPTGQKPTAVELLLPSCLVLFLTVGLFTASISWPTYSKPVLVACRMCSGQERSLPWLWPACPACSGDAGGRAALLLLWEQIGSRQGQEQAEMWWGLLWFCFKMLDVHR